MIENNAGMTLLLVASAGVLFGILLSMVFLRKQLTSSIQKNLKHSKDRFIGLASHYLLTPITIIQTALSRLQESDASLSLEQRNKLYEAIAMGQQRLWIIAEQLILISEIDQNNLKAKIAVHNFSEIVGNTVATMDIFARTKNIELIFEDTIHEPVEGRMDARRIKQAVVAIIDNAIKFSIEGTQVRVQISIEEGNFIVRVKDQGIGMPEEVLTKMGERFYRGSSIYEFDYEGFGLGVHIADAIAKIHQGQMTFISQPKLGTVATLEFPRV